MIEIHKVGWVEQVIITLIHSLMRLNTIPLARGAWFGPGRYVCEEYSISNTVMYSSNLGNAKNK